jgi:long-subunit acyl-CoA synthetase (AMP-forming)
MTGVVTDIATVSDAFLAQVERCGDEPTILSTDLDAAYTWREYGATAHRLAAALGLRHRDVLGLLVRNRPEFHLAVTAALLVGVVRADARMSRVGQINYFAVLTDVWLPDSDELTPTMKLKRRSIAQKYAAQIEALYTKMEDQ